MAEYPQWFLDRLNSITAKRAKTVIDHIRQHGHVTTEELKDQYGYQHPPRAARDVREFGIALETFNVRDSQGRSIGAYRFIVPSSDSRSAMKGRMLLPKQLKETVLARDGSKCAICTTVYAGRNLQLDHRVPFEIAGDSEEPKAKDFMCVCGSCNRAKSWSCEHCENWKVAKKPDVCLTCYWGSPQTYTHIALRQIRRLDVVWSEAEVPEFDQLVKDAEKAGTKLPEYVKDALRRRKK